MTQGVDTLATNGLAAGATPGGKSTIEAALTIRARLLLKEGPSLKGTEALSADEVVDVPLLVEGCDTTVQDGFVTMSTSSTKQLLVTFFTVRLTILLVEVIGAKWVLAVTTHKVLWMVCIAKGLDDFSKNCITTVSTSASRSGSLVIDILHLGGEVLKQVIQVVTSEWLCHPSN